MAEKTKANLISKGKAKYTKKVGAIGADAYRACGKSGGMDTAICMMGLKKAAGDVSDWANAWEESMK